MKRSKPESAAAPDPFDEWMAAPKRYVRVCRTCSTAGEEVLAKIVAYVARGRAGKENWTIDDFRDKLNEVYGYNLSTAALGKHIRICLGYYSRAR